MEAVKCRHQEEVTSTPSAPGIEIGFCSKCGQTIQYNHKGMSTTVTVTKLGRIDGNVVLPRPGYRLLLSDVDINDLKTASSSAAPSAEGPAFEEEVAPPAPVPRKLKREEHREYWEQNRHDIIEDYYKMTQLVFFEKWGLSSNGWMKLRKEWEVAPKGLVNRYTRFKKPDEAKPKSSQALPEFPKFNEGWTPAVKIEWFRSYKEIMLAIGGK